MKSVELYVRNVDNNDNLKEIRSKLDDIGLKYEIFDISHLDTRDMSYSGNLVLSDPNMDDNDNGDNKSRVSENGTKLVGKNEIIGHLNDNYQSRRWRKMQIISDGIYHIADAIFELI